MPPGGTYTQLTREDFEGWLTRDLGFSPSEWRLKPGRGGVYQLFLSPTVAIEVNSTTGSQDAVMERGSASMSLWLASRVNGKVLNKKAMGQSHFARTLNWRDNWKKGVERMKDAYLKSKDFYDRLASIEDLDQYKRDTLALIESNDGWQNNTFLSDMHDKVQRGSILSEKQQAALAPRRAPTPAAAEDPRIQGLRELWSRANRSQDKWTADFVRSIAEQLKAGRRLSPKQEALLDDKARFYAVRVAAQRVARLVKGL